MAEQEGVGLRAARRGEAVARRLHRPVGRVHRAGVLIGVRDPVDRRRDQRDGQGRRRRRAARRAHRGDRDLRARLDRRHVREARARGGIALRLRHDEPRRERRDGVGLALLQRHDRADGRPHRPDGRLPPRHPRRGVPPSDHGRLAVERRDRARDLPHPLPGGADLDARAAHARADLDGGRAHVLPLRDRRSSAARTTSRRPSTPRPRPTDGPACCSASCTGC